MKVRVKKTETAEIDDEQALEIAREVLREKFRMPEHYQINNVGDLIKTVEMRGHCYREVVRKVTEQDRLFFTVLKVLEGGENADAG